MLSAVSGCAASEPISSAVLCSLSYLLYYEVKSGLSDCCIDRAVSPPPKVELAKAPPRPHMHEVHLLGIADPTGAKGIQVIIFSPCD